MKIKPLLVSVLALFLVSGCEEKSPSIATTVYPVQYLVERIDGDDVTASNTIGNTTIQRAQIKSSFQDILKDSDALFYIGGLEPYMDLYVDDIRDTGADMVDFATKGAVYKSERHTSATIDDITAGTEGPYYEGEEFASLDTYGVGPMLWMDPVVMTSMASDIRDYLVQRHPQYKDILGENYDALELDPTRLEADFQAIPDGKANTSFVSVTPSSGNWQKSYSTKVYLIILSKYGVLPTSDQLTVMKKCIKSDHIRYTATKQNLSENMGKLQQQLADELALISVNLNNLFSTSSEDKKASRDYLTIMYDNLKVLESTVSQRS